MYDTFEANNSAKARHQEMINEAMIYRRFPKKNTGRQAFAKLLINVGQKLKGQQTVRVHPALSPK